jgi:hypothetical protein
MALCAISKLALLTRRAGYMVKDDVSPPGAWKEEMERAPWAFGQRQGDRVVNAFVAMRRMGLHDEATLLELEIKTLRNEIEYLLNR